MAVIIPFLPAGCDDSPCVRDDSSPGWVSYGELRSRAIKWAGRLETPKTLIFLHAYNDVESLAALLGAIAAGHAVALVDPELPSASQAELASRYSPEFVIDCSAANPLASFERQSEEPHPQLSLLLSTSGSTGSPKFVRLTLANLVDNARAIAQVLAIGSDSVACGHLPIHYSFGLSVVTSHLVAGGRIALTGLGFMERAFWEAIRTAGVTHLPGVPFHFSIMERLGYGRLRLPSLTCLAQAGGHLDLAARERAHAYMQQRNGRFYVMYGQTEASPRMTTLQHEDFAIAPGSVGTPLPHGSIQIEDPDADGRGEVVYRGPNVMMGYAEQRDELAKGDEQGGVLRTGDLGYLDDGGRLTLTGRAKRSAKAYGLRVNLDEVEKLTNTLCISAVVESGAGIRIFYETASGTTPDELRDLLTSRFSLPVAGYTFTAVDSVPRTARGKIDYERLGAAE